MSATSELSRREFLAACSSPALGGGVGSEARKSTRLYVAVPGVRNYLEYGGIGILVYDVDHGHNLIKRIPSWPLRPDVPAENVKGICASATTGRLFVSTVKRVGCFDLVSEAMMWDREFPGGCDRLSISSDGRTLFIPSLEGPTWTVADAASGKVIANVETNSGAHNTVTSLDGAHVYLAGLKSNYLNVLDARSHQLLAPCGPFGNVIRPFTVNGSRTRCFVNVNDLLGFEVGDLISGKPLGRVEVPRHSKGPVKRHGCPSHGIALSPNEKEIWLADAFNSSLHLFANTMPLPKYVRSIKLRDEPGWVRFSLDGRYLYPSTGEVIEAVTKRVVAVLLDENRHPIQSEKMVDVVWNEGRPFSNGDQFGVGRMKGNWSSREP